MASLPNFTGGYNPFSSSSFAGMGGDFLSGQLGIQPNLLGTLGGVGGSFFGPVGSFAGNFLGNALGSAFGMGAPKPPRPRFNYIYDFATGNPYLKGGKAYDSGAMDQFYGMADTLGDTTKSILDTLGIAPSVNKFGFGAFQGRAGFALPTDPFVRDVNSPGAFNAIGPSSPGRKQAKAMGRSFGNFGNRGTGINENALTSAYDAAIDELVTSSIAKAGLTNQQVFEKFGMPYTSEGLSGILPNLALGENYDPNAAFQFRLADLASGVPSLGQAGQLPATPSQPPAGNALNLYNLYNRMAPRLMTQGSWSRQPSYYARG